MFVSGWRGNTIIKKREAAKRAPNKFLSLIVDGMDQCKFSLYGFCLPNGDTYKYFCTQSA